MSQKNTQQQEQISSASELNYSDDRYQGLLEMMGIGGDDVASNSAPNSSVKPNIFSQVSQLEFAFGKSQ